MENKSRYIALTADDVDVIEDMHYTKEGVMEAASTAMDSQDIRTNQIIIYKLVPIARLARKVVVEDLE